MKGEHIGDASREWTRGEYRLACWYTREYGRKVREHEHPNAHVMFVMAGEYRSRIRAAAGARQPILFNPAGTIHDDRFESPGLFFSINFPCASQSPWRDGLPATPALATTGRARMILDGLMRAERGSAAQDDIEWRVAELMAQFGAPDSARCPRWMSRVVDAIHECRPMPRMKELAALAQVHPAYLASAFRRRYGCTPAGYARNLRMKQALDGLLRTRMSLAELASEHGYSDQSHFTRSVSGLLGLAPAALRRRLA